MIETSLVPNTGKQQERNKKNRAKGECFHRTQERVVEEYAKIQQDTLNGKSQASPPFCLTLPKKRKIRAGVIDIFKETA
jgi:hypothetical protein